MELSDLSQDERVALVALIELVTEAVPEVTREQERTIDRVVRSVGRREYDAAVAQADARFEGGEQLREFLGTIERREAQNLIYATVLEEAITNSVDPREGELLEWLADLWKIDVQVKDEGA